MIEMEPFAGWIIKSELGKGTYSNVYLSEKNGTYSAIKQIIIPNNTKYNLDFSRFRGNTDEIKRFYQPEIDRMMKEVNILSNLSGIPGIVIYQDHLLRSYKMRSGWEILIRMEYLTPLDKYINKNGITIKQIIKMGIDLCFALEVCNKEGILHRDIKEGNILIDSRGNFKLCDFGVSKSLDGASHAFTVTGTYGYMAPEVENGSEYDHRADLYSLGIVMYKLLNDWLMPFMKKYSTSSDDEKCRISLLKGETFPIPTHGNETISKVILKACAYKKNHRYSTFLEFNEALTKLLETTDDKLLDTFVIDVLLENTSLLPNSSNSFYDSFLYNSSNNKVSTSVHSNSASKNKFFDTNKSSKKPKLQKPKVNWLYNNPRTPLVIIFHLFFLFIVFFTIYPLFNKKDIPPIPGNQALANISTSKNKTEVNIGDYIQFGTYLKRPILWKCYDKNKNGLLLVSKYILCLKAYDSAESGIEGTGNNNVEVHGNNNWDTSNIREWLNSIDTKVNYTSTPPVKSALWNGYNAYVDEPGFLSSFSDNEISKIQPIQHGQIKDTIFLLSKYEILTIWQNIEERKHSPTEFAIKNTDFKSNKLKINYTWWYWTRDPSSNSESSVSFVDGDGSYDDFDNASSGNFGILPAVYISPSKFKTGNGQSNNPFILK